MRIAFIGKGGAGKTTVAGAFIEYLRKKEKSVLAIDADINLHLRSYLNMPPVLERLGSGFDEVLAYVKGSRTDLTVAPRVGSLPPCSRSRFIRPLPNDPLVQQFASKQSSCVFLEVGTYEHQEIGASCFHGKLNALELLLHHTLDTSEEWIVIDSTAGTDIFATSLLIAMDVLVFVVEPTKKSLEVFELFQKTLACVSHAYPVKICVIGNKVQTSEEEGFIRGRIPDQYHAVFLPFSGSMRRYERGEEDQKGIFLKQAESSMQALYAAVIPHKRDEDISYQALGEIFVKECRDWVNNAYHGQFEKLFDPAFRYQDARELLQLIS